MMRGRGARAPGRRKANPPYAERSARSHSMPGLNSHASARCHAANDPAVSSSMFTGRTGCDGSFRAIQCIDRTHSCFSHRSGSAISTPATLVRRRLPGLDHLPDQLPRIDPEAITRQRPPPDGMAQHLRHHGREPQLLERRRLAGTHGRSQFGGDDQRHHPPRDLVGLADDSYSAQGPGTSSRTVA